MNVHGRLARLEGQVLPMACPACGAGGRLTITMDVNGTLLLPPPCGTCGAETVPFTLDILHPRGLGVDEDD